ncbi:MAG: uroporphyrinogen-III C-methyltransferase [Pseudomonadota bacterium]
MNVSPVQLIGAGPGDPELLTIRAARVLQSAQVVVYDRLVGREILALIPAGAERIYVGKRKHLHTLSQPMIHEVLIDRARQGLKVVRLKGGDPLIFGRGGEEADALTAAGVPWTIVPGITAAVGGAASQGICLTHRDNNQAVSFVTAHRRHGLLDLDWDLLLRPNHVTVIYMGVSVISAIATGLRSRGMARDTPISIISRATLPDEQALTTSLGILAEGKCGIAVCAPAVLILGAHYCNPAATPAPNQTLDRKPICCRNSADSRL